MSPAGKGILYGVLVTSVILLVALVISIPNGRTLALAVAIGVAVAIAAWYQDRRR
jgi:hypothetical protein